jgi:shikimate kinase
VNIALFGFMGVGKTVVGKAVANKMGLEFNDIDELVVKKAKKPISQIFQEEGEKSFRKIESKITEEIASRDNQIIALGGGTILDQNNLEQLKKNSVLILLTANPNIILSRTNSDGLVRPLLNVEDKIGRIQALLFERLPKYLAAADYIVDTSEGNPNEIAEEIIEGIGRFENCL